MRPLPPASQNKKIDLPRRAQQQQLAAAFASAARKGGLGGGGGSDDDEAGRGWLTATRAFAITPPLTHPPASVNFGWPPRCQRRRQAHRAR